VRGQHTLAFALALILLSGPVAAATEEAAWATEYPTWTQVENARASEGAVKTLVAQIQVQIEALTAETARAAEVALQKGGEYEKADSKFQEAAVKAEGLRGQADLAQSVAKKSRTFAGRVAAQMARANGGDITSRLLSNPADAGDLLSQLGYADRIAQSAEDAYNRATQEQNTAGVLTDQADLARDALGVLRLKAESALASAQEAEHAADTALAAQVMHQADLEAQLSVLTEKRSATERDYSAGEAAKAAARAAAEAARAAAGAGPAGQVAESGWANPTSGRVTSSFGWRLHPVYGTYSLHSGIDIAGGCNVPIYAAAAGHVVYSGFSGGYGNWILLDHGNGLQTGYAHIIDGGRLVSSGQTVSAGQMIARAGSTGASTGCHLHFEVRPNGSAVDPWTFMQNRGVSLG
jgi:murein DD-endopeptidase MepM/ murein hydrolase activator NlpD